MAKNKHVLSPKLFLTLLLTVAAAAATNGLDSPSSKIWRPWPFKKLNKPVVLMISCDGFRFGYQFKTDTPNIDFLISGGTEAKSGLIPVFPTMTFPNHYSIATGLYPAYHGIIMNSFTDPVTGDKFNKGLDPKWWLGEPLWVTAANQGRKAVTYFWPGSEVPKGSWTCPKEYCPQFNVSVPLEERVDTVLNYFDLPVSEIPDFLMLYFDEPDKEGHEYGPDDPRVTAAVSKVDKMIGRVIEGLKKREIFDEVHIILLGDHGMVTNCDKKTIYIEDLADWIKIPADWIYAYSPVLAINPRWGIDVENPGEKNAEVVSKMNEALSSGKVENGELLQVYLKEKLPERLHYSESSRIPPIIGMVGEGLVVRQNRTNAHECYGDHGYDNKYFSMRSIFIGHGPRFKRGRKVPSFENVEVYNVVAEILGLRPAPNNGSSLFTRSLLLPVGETAQVE
uniref:Ectonucleotide pyrophosphatase/phosphodiesterase family member 3 n=1 Tax=Noccaea caerulescens TaxID=107243 RepID=A0A1J3E796_NOCCA